MKRKLPSPEIVNRLYWIDGLSTPEIARLYRVAQHSVVVGFMQRYGIPRRKPGNQKRATETRCLECRAPVCFRKVWRGGIWTWIQQRRCALHQTEHMRRVSRESKRRRRRTPPERYTAWKGPLKKIWGDLRLYPPGEGEAA